MNNYFMGQDGFTWFIGVVEDRADPEFAGRVRVRCLATIQQTRKRFLLLTCLGPR